MGARSNPPKELRRLGVNQRSKFASYLVEGDIVAVFHVNDVQDFVNISSWRATDSKYRGVVMENWLPNKPGEKKSVPAKIYLLEEKGEDGKYHSIRSKNRIVEAFSVVRQEFDTAQGGTPREKVPENTYRFKVMRPTVAPNEVEIPSLGVKTDAMIVFDSDGDLDSGKSMVMFTLGKKTKELSFDDARNLFSEYLVINVLDAKPGSSPETPKPANSVFVSLWEISVWDTRRGTRRASSTHDFYVDKKYVESIGGLQPGDVVWGRVRGGIDWQGGESGYYAYIFTPSEPENSLRVDKWFRPVKKVTKAEVEKVEKETVFETGEIAKWPIRFAQEDGGA